MSVRVLPRQTSSTSSSSTSNGAISYRLPASTISSPTSFPASGSPPSPPHLPFPASTDFQSSLSWAPPPPSTTSAIPSPSQPSATPVTSVFVSQNPGSPGLVSASLSSPGANGVVVVGVIGKVEHDVSQLLDRLLESHVFCVKSRVWEQWHENEEQGSPSANSVSVGIRDRKRRKDGHRVRGTEPQASGVLEGGCGSTSSVNPAANDSGLKRGAGSENRDYGCRKEGKIEGCRSEKGHVGNRDSDKTKELRGEVRSGKGGDENLGKAPDKLKESHCHVPWLLSKIKYHHDVEKGMVYVQFTWGARPLECMKMDSLKVAVPPDGLFSSLEHHEADGMRGLLFMFSVCHVIIIVQEGARFDPHFLRTFRLLQTAKHCLAPFVKTQVLPGLLPPPLSTNRPSGLKPISLATSAVSGRTGVVGRNLPTVALMSGSTPVLFPGQCTPVVLFVCLEDVLEPAPSTRPEDVLDASPIDGQVGSLSQSGNCFPRQTAHVRPASSGVAVVKNNKKLEPGLRKKLQFSIEAQIRFLLKKCRTIAGPGDACPLGTGVGSGSQLRGPGSIVNSFQGVGGGGALFVLDPSRAVILLDRSVNWQMDALDAAVDGIEAMLPEKECSENVLWDLGSNLMTTGSRVNSAGEDVQSMKDFLLRQSEMLRGRGGISSNAGGGSAGVGMVAAAAAAAAASAASGVSGGISKATCSPPELPTFSSWLSACRVLGEALSARHAEWGELGPIHNEISDGIRILMKKGAVGPKRMSGSTGSLDRSKVNIESSLSCLETGAQMDLKFSAAWCVRVLPSAQDVYRKGLPPSYPSNVHKSQLEQCLRSFHSMVRGHAVSLYAQKLKQECEAVWHSGKQLCDAESLTGKPCIHHIHEVIDTFTSIELPYREKDASQNKLKTACKKPIVKPHSSGIVFLHACACGRSRKLRKDPFDFESANVSFFMFPNCEDLLPSLVIPSPSGGLRSGGSPWSLVCLGKSHYYQPSVGLVQSGFFPNQNFLSSLDIFVVFQTADDTLVEIPVSPEEEVADFGPSGNGKVFVDQRPATKLLVSGAQLIASNPFENAASDGYSGGTRAVSARGTARSSGARKIPRDMATKEDNGLESAFPILVKHQDMPPGLVAKCPKQSTDMERRDSVLVKDNQITISKALVNEFAEIEHRKLGTSFDAKEFYVLDVQKSLKSSLGSMQKQVRLYIGFEHECPHGHRFLISEVQPGRPGSSNSSPIAGLGLSSKHEEHKQSDSHSKHSVPVAQSQAFRTSARPFPILPQDCMDKKMKIPSAMQYGTVQDEHSVGHFLLNSNIPIYKHCPYCKASEEDNKMPRKEIVFGGTISQLQRIFLVTPPLPFRLASCPVVEFEDISKPVKTVMQFSPGSEVVLPPDSFLSLRLPFVYYSHLEGAPYKPLLVKKNQPEHSAWLVKNTALYLLSKEGMNGMSGG